MEEKVTAAAINQLIRNAMPGVLALVAAKRKAWGDAHVTECQRRGMRGEPGWFFAREGPIAVGTPWTDGEFSELDRVMYTRTQAILVMRQPDPMQVRDGKN